MTTPPKTEAEARGAANQRRGAAFERRIAKEVGGRRVPLSGGASIKGDVITPYLLLECKTSTARNSRGQKSIGLQEEWLLKAEAEAAAEGKRLWALPFFFRGSTRTWVAMDWALVVQIFAQLADYYRLLEEAE
jgi:hypothetical protein